MERPDIERLTEVVRMEVLSASAGRKACCFTGHRPSGLPKRGSEAYGLLVLLVKACIDAAIENGIDTFYCGGAAGFDQISAEYVLQMKARRKDLRLILALPGEDYGSRRGENRTMLQQADGLWYADRITTGEGFIRRNRYMVNRSDFCIACVLHHTSGSMFTMNYALSADKPVINLGMYL